MIELINEKILNECLEKLNIFMNDFEMTRGERIILLETYLQILKSNMTIEYSKALKNAGI